MNSIPYTPAPLHGVPTPDKVITREQSWHRAALYMKAWGKSNQEISKALGHSASQVSLIVRQPWFQKELLSLLHANGADGLDEMIKCMAPDAANIAYEVMTTTDSDELRAKCAFDLLKLHKGTKVTVVNDNRPLDAVEEDTRRLEAELAELTNAKRG